MTYYQTQQTEQALRALPTSQFLPSLAALEAFRILDEVRVALDRDPAAARVGVDRLESFLKVTIETLGPAVVRGGLTPSQRRKVEAHIEEQLGTPIPVKTLADLVFLSFGHFSRAFKETFGNSPHAHIIRRRIARAQEMMLASREPLGQIALACGFADQAHMTTLFRRVVGRTPNDWRRANSMPY